MQLHTYTSDSAAWITAPLLVFSALNWCDSCESLSYRHAQELPEYHVGCTSQPALCPLSSHLPPPSLHLWCSLSLSCLPPSTPARLLTPAPETSPAAGVQF
jgi:hypothetical protein